MGVSVGEEWEVERNWGRDAPPWYGYADCGKRMGKTLQASSWNLQRKRCSLIFTRAKKRLT